jgi:hypothetical protein
VVLLSKIEAAFTVPGRGCVIVPAEITSRVHNGDTIRLRAASGNVIDAHIVGIERINTSGPSRVGLLLSENVSKTDIPLDA